MKLCQVIVLAYILLISRTSAGRVFRLHRSVDEAATTTTTTQSTTSNVEIKCEENTPCGWAVYTPFTRKVDYFMKNTCVCSSNKVCLKTDDDLSVSAYVYRCRTLKNDETNSS